MLQNELQEKNRTIIDKIKESDKDMTQKLANKKYLEHETKKLVKKEEKLEQRWEMEKNNFIKTYGDSIKKCKEE